MKNELSDTIVVRMWDWDKLKNLSDESIRQSYARGEMIGGNGDGGRGLNFGGECELLSIPPSWESMIAGKEVELQKSSSLPESQDVTGWQIIDGGKRTGRRVCAKWFDWGTKRNTENNRPREYGIAGDDWWERWSAQQTRDELS